MVRLALKRIVVHGEDFLVVVLPRDGVGDLIQVHQLVDHHQQTLVSGARQKLGKQLQIVVPGIVGDAGIDAQFTARFGLRAVLATKPLRNIALYLIVFL